MNAPNFSVRHTEVLRTVVGSEVQGIQLAGTEDHDEMGTFLETPEQLMLVTPPKTITVRTQPEGERSGPGDTDLVLHPLRKFVHLALKGNPTVLLPLFVPFEFVLHQTEAGMELRDNRHKFISRHCLNAFVGYSVQQYERFIGVRGGKHTNRPELIEKYGYDTKYASHALRLTFQGIEVAKTGEFTLPMSSIERKMCQEVREGRWTYNTVETRLNEAIVKLRLAMAHSDVPLEPDTEWAIDWCARAHNKMWEDA